jgi:hypothetical protein
MQTGGGWMVKIGQGIAKIRLDLIHPQASLYGHERWRFIVTRHRRPVGKFFQ